MEQAIFEERRDQIHRTGDGPFELACNRESLAGAVYITTTEDVIL